MSLWLRILVGAVGVCLIAVVAVALNPFKAPSEGIDRQWCAGTLCFGGGQCGRRVYRSFAGAESPVRLILPNPGGAGSGDPVDPESDLCHMTRLEKGRLPTRSEAAFLITRKPYFSMTEDGGKRYFAMEGSL